MFRSRCVFLALVFCLGAARAFAQGNPTGTIAGHVTDPDNLPLPGVSVTVASEALQGTQIGRAHV